MHRKAIIIANSVVSQRTQAPVKRSFIDHTAGEVAQVLKGLPQQYSFDVETVVDEAPNTAKHRVTTLAEKAERGGGLLLVYYFGHGRLQDDDLAFAHRSSKKGQADFLPFRQLLNYIGAGGARKALIILDCCYAGAGAFTLGLHGAPYCLMACTASSTRAWYNQGVERPFGFFTTSILDGLSIADATVSVTDDSITADSLFKYAKKATQESTGGLQVPNLAGNLDEVLTKYSEAPETIQGVTDAPVKSGYSKLLAVLAAIGSKRVATIDNLHRIVLKNHREAFLTPYKEADGRITERPAKPSVLRRYVSFLRAVGALDEQELMLTVSGMRLIADHRRHYNDRLLELLDLYLSQFGLTREKVRAAMQSILQRRLLTTKKNVSNELARSTGHSLSQAKVGMLLDLLGHIRAVGMPRRREQVYFPWTGSARRRRHR